jgi:RNA polymerase sigma-70 factor (family 1)
LDIAAAQKDKLLFNRIAAGDVKAFAEIFNVYAPRLAINVSKLLHADQWTQEIVQDVFVKLWDVRETLTRIDSPADYLYRMSANRVQDYLRKQEREIKLQYYLDCNSKGDLTNNTQEKLDLRFSQQLFSEAVQLLPPQRALIFKLRHEEGLGYDEIAARLDLSRNTVRNHLMLALKQMREYLIRHGIVLLLFLH